jgi:hypothetical protein
MLTGVAWEQSLVEIVQINELEEIGFSGRLSQAIRKSITPGSHGDVIEALSYIKILLLSLVTYSTIVSVTHIPIERVINELPYSTLLIIPFFSKNLPLYNTYYEELADSQLVRSSERVTRKSLIYLSKHSPYTQTYPFLPISKGKSMSLPLNGTVVSHTNWREQESTKDILILSAEIFVQPCSKS